ncbi:uncharacterized protein LOC109840573 isoform X2 [Asparagus officinalis]|uniref:uncharacterized protein LOC109840573 isoform X2 n=1 Tax=Asparagus officinalis TaxID=4686 RepID=UPI00098DE63B|nr:uncharacterized protein LOC109840573 isoform X2 [Asparagus officinalis]
MASRLRSISRPALSFMKSSAKKPTNPFSSSSSPLQSRPLQFSRVSRGIASLESMLPFHSAVSSARLTSRLGIDSAGGSRSLSQELGVSVPR